MLAGEALVVDAHHVLDLELGEQLVLAHEALEEHLVLAQARVEHFQRDAQAVEVALGEIHLRLAAFADASQHGEACYEGLAHRPYTATMLKLFGGGADHPMSNPKEARRILEALPAEDLKALEELAHWLESVSVAEGFKPPERAALACALDEAAQPPLRQVARADCGTARASRYQEKRMWTQVHEYSEHARVP